MDVEVFSQNLHAIISPGAKLEVVKTGFQFIEGPIWREKEQDLLFSDIPANKIYRWSDAGRLTVFREPSGHSNGLTLDKEGNLIACEHGNRRVSITQPNGTIRALATDYQGKKLNSPNDVVVAQDGTIFFTDPPYGIEEKDKELDFNGVYCLQPGKEPVLLVDDFDRPNGLALSPDESLLYVDDTTRGHVRVFNVRPDKTITGGRVLVELDPRLGKGVPDGLKVDTKGNIYVTGPGGVWIVAPSGEALGVIRIPEVCANLAFGGPDWKTLYFTATSTLYRTTVNVKGKA